MLYSLDFVEFSKALRDYFILCFSIFYFFILFYLFVTILQSKDYMFVPDNFVDKGVPQTLCHRIRGLGKFRFSSSRLWKIISGS